MTTARTPRYCRCGRPLARDNNGARCSACVASDRSQRDTAPEVPTDFWDESIVRDALLDRHMGRVIRAWRTHPHHGRRSIPQDRVASWAGITQAQLSRIENGPPLVHLDRLIQWARVLHIPPARLWFALPTGDTTGRPSHEEDSVKRRKFLATAGATFAGTLTGPLAAPTHIGQITTTEQAAEWFAWRLWQDHVDRLHRSQMPARVVYSLAGHPNILVDDDGFHRFADPDLMHILVAQRLFNDITQGSGHLLATAQTSHATDLAVGAMAAHNETAMRALAGWMRQGTTAVLRVNAAGVLAKVGTPDLGDAAITTLLNDQDARHLYLTAVASRVLDTSWESAYQTAADLSVSASNSNRLAESQGIWVARRLAAELSNRRDAAARWCAAVMLAPLHDHAPDVARAALRHAISHESCRENLRAYAAVLAGTDPISV